MSASRPLAEIRAWADEHRHEADCDIAECVLASDWMRTIETALNARWHRALEDPSTEPPGPIRDHIVQALARAQSLQVPRQNRA